MNELKDIFARYMTRQYRMVNYIQSINNILTNIIIEQGFEVSDEMKKFFELYGELVTDIAEEKKDIKEMLTAINKAKNE